MARQPNDPARRAAAQKYEKLMAEYEQQWEIKRKEIAARLFQDDAKKDEPAKEDKGRATAERFEEHVKDLIEKLAKELGPVGEELRKILEKSVDEIHETLKKEGVAPDDLRKALEKSHNEMRKGLEKGGSVNKELRETVEKSRRDLQGEWERARNDLRMAMRDRVQPRRQQERTEEAQKDADQADSAKKEAAEIEKERAELEKARSEVRALEQQLRQASRRLGEMQRRTMQRAWPRRPSRGCSSRPIGPGSRTGRPAFRNLRPVHGLPDHQQRRPFRPLPHRRDGLSPRGCPAARGASSTAWSTGHEAQVLASTRSTSSVCETSMTSSRNCSRRSRSSRRKRSPKSRRTLTLAERGLPVQAPPLPSVRFSGRRVPSPSPGRNSRRG